MILKDIKKILEQEEFECTLAPLNAEMPFNRLLVFLGLDNKKRERLLEVISHQPQISPELIPSTPTSLPYRLQFRILLPFKVQDLALNQVASLLLFLNQLIDLPGFELNELEGQVLYRYVWIMHPSFIDVSLLMTIIGAIMLNLGLFTESIESLASGKMTFNDLLSQIINIADSSHFKPPLSS